MQSWRYGKISYLTDLFALRQTNKVYLLSYSAMNNKHVIAIIASQMFPLPSQYTFLAKFHLTWNISRTFFFFNTIYLFWSTFKESRLLIRTFDSGN